MKKCVKCEGRLINNFKQKYMDPPPLPYCFLLLHNFFDICGNYFLASLYHFATYMCILKPHSMESLSGTLY